MSNHQKMIDFCKSKDSNSMILGVPAILVELTGDIESAVFLSQVIFWSDKNRYLDGQFYKSYDDWKQELGYGRSRLDRIRDKLKEKGYIDFESHLIVGGDKVLHWSADLDIVMRDLDELYQQKSENENGKSDNAMLKSDKSVLNDSNTRVSSKIDSPEMNEIDKPLTEIKQKLQSEINSEREIELMCCRDSTADDSFIEEANLSEESLFRITVHNYLLGEILTITKEDNLNEDCFDKLLEIAVNVNYSHSGSNEWSPDKPCIGFLVKMLSWAKNKYDEGERLSPRNILNAISNPKHLKRFRDTNGKVNPFFKRDDSRMAYAFLESQLG